MTEAGCTSPGDWIYVGIIVFATIGSAIPISIWTMHKYRLYQHRITKNNPSMKSSSKFTYRCSKAFYVTSIIFFGSFVIYIILRCVQVPLWLFFAMIATLAHNLHWTLLIAIYFGRLYFVFKGTSLAIPKRHIWYFVAFSIALVLFVIGFLLFSKFIFFHPALIVLGWIISYVAAGILTLVLFVMFLKKLVQLRKMESTSSEAQVLADKMRKYTLLNAISSFTTLLFISWMCLLIVLPTNILVRRMTILLNLLDCWTNAVCMTLAFRFANDQYLKFCGKCDRKVAHLCDHDGDESKMKQTMEADSKSKGNVDNADSKTEQTQNTMVIT